MFDMRDIFRNIITKRLADAPVGPAKGELIEELTDNLLCRYNDLVEAGVDPGDAQTQALDALGDTNELVEYLKSLEPDEALPKLALDPDKEDGGQLGDLMKNVEDLIRSAMEHGNIAGWLCVQQKGAIESLPTSEAVAHYWEELYHA